MLARQQLPCWPVNMFSNCMYKLSSCVLIFSSFTTEKGEPKPLRDKFVSGLDSVLHSPQQPKQKFWSYRRKKSRTQSEISLTQTYLTAVNFRDMLPVNLLVIRNLSAFHFQICNFGQSFVSDFKRHVRFFSDFWQQQCLLEMSRTTRAWHLRQTHNCHLMSPPLWPARWNRRT